MDSDMGWVFTALAVGIVALYALLKRVNEWIYGSSSGAMLPPGDMGLPFIGSTWSFSKAFKYGGPDSVISSFTSRYGRAPMYKALLFGKPTIIVTAEETCRKVLTDDRFGPGLSKSVSDLLGKKGLNGVSDQERKRLRQLIASPVAGHEALSSFIKCITGIAETSFQTWANMDKPIELLTEARKAIIKVMMNVIMSNAIDQKLLDHLEEEFAVLSRGIKSMAINLPGFPYHRALKARKKLLVIFQDIVWRRRMMAIGDQSERKKDMLTLMMEISDGNGNKLSDEEIVDLVIIFVLAGHDSSGHTLTWAIIYLKEHPHFLQMAKEEQEDIVKRRASPEDGLNLDEVKQMKYLQKVINETLRLVNISFALLREAKTDINMNGYTIPKGWKIFTWIRNVHLDPENHENPKDFNPSRWDDPKVRISAFLPFGAGSRSCPGADFAKLQISVFLHYFLLNYRIERINSNCGIEYLPTPRPVDKCLARIMKLS